MSSVHGVQLPSGWSQKTFTHNGSAFIEITAPCGEFSCSVTVDLKRRTFRTGYSFAGQFATNKIYKRRGWREHLFADAIAHLQGAIGRA